MHCDSSGPFRCNMAAVHAAPLAWLCHFTSEVNGCLVDCRHRYAVVCSISSTRQHAARQKPQSAQKEPLFEHACVHCDSSGPFRCNMAAVHAAPLAWLCHFTSEVNGCLVDCRHRYAVVCSISSTRQHAARQKPQSAQKEPLFEHACVHCDSSGPFRCNMAAVHAAPLAWLCHFTSEVNGCLVDCRHRYAVVCSISSTRQHAARQKPQSAQKEPLFEHACVHCDSSGPFRCNMAAVHAAPLARHGFVISRRR